MIRRRPAIVGWIGALADLAVAVVLGVALVAITDGRGDAIPRPLVVAALFGTPGIIGLIGARAGRRSLLVAAGLPLIPGAVLSVATLIFVVPAGLMLAGAITVPRSSPRSFATPGSVAMAVAISACVIVAGWAVLIGMTRASCGTDPDGTEFCGTGQITPEGVIVAATLLLAALALAAAWARKRMADPA